MNDLFTLMHDTMSPVATIKGAVKLLQGGTLTQEETNRMLEAIDDRANRLNDTLDSYWRLVKAEDPNWQESWTEFTKTPEFQSIHKHNLSSAYLKWLQANYSKPIKK